MKHLKALLIRTLLLLLLPGAAVVTAQAANHGYGYWQLTDNQKYIYDLLADGVARCASQIDIDTTRGISQNDLTVASQIFASDYAEYAWFGVKSGDSVNYLQAYGTSAGVSRIDPLYNRSDASGCQSSLQSTAQAIIAGMPAASQYEQARYLHDYLVSHVSYSYGDSNTMTAYGALVQGSAGCVGYARAFQYLLQRAGIPAWTIQGSAYNASGSVSHAWNAACLDGTWYYIDVTWDDTAAGLSYTYFGMSLSAISADHFAAAPYSSMLPSGSWSVSPFYADTMTVSAAVSAEAEAEAEMEEPSPETEAEAAEEPAGDPEETPIASPVEEPAQEPEEETPAAKTASAPARIVCFSLLGLGGIAMAARIFLKKKP